MTRESSPLFDAKIREAITRDAPRGAAETLWFDVSDRLDATPQRRRGLMVTMSTGMRFAAIAAIAVIAVVGGSVYFLAPNQGVGIPAPSAQPTVTPTATPEPSSAQAEATVPADWTTYTSSRFAYTVDHPAEWIVIPATQDWTSAYPQDHGGQTVDYVGAKAFGPRVFLSSILLKPDRDAATWISTFDSWNAQPAHCDPTSDRHSITMDAVTMRQEDQYCGDTVHIVEVLGAHNGRFYVIDFVSEAQFTPEDRATFDRFLASFRFASPSPAGS